MNKAKHASHVIPEELGSVLSGPDSSNVCFQRADRRSASDEIDYEDESYISDVQITNQRSQWGYRFIKRSFDIVASLCGIIILSPVFIAVAIAVKVTSKGPVIFEQKRYGKAGKPFFLYKFRTMTTNAPPDIPTREMQENISYMTSIGPFLRKRSLDELPQFFNILKGEMSVVGPRPVILQEADQIMAREQYGANNIRPGLTGWAQINGRDAVGVEAKARYDGEYCEKMSVAFDAKCFLRSWVVVVTGQGFGDAIAIEEAEEEGESLDELFAGEMRDNAESISVEQNGVSQ